MNNRTLLGIVLLLVGGTLIAYWLLNRGDDPVQTVATNPPANTAIEIAQADTSGVADPAPQTPTTTTPTTTLPPPAPVVPAGTPVVYVLRDLPAGARVTLADIGTQYLEAAPADTFRAASDVVNRILTSPLTANALLSEAAFRETTSPIADRLFPGERAVAIAVDEVIGGGGFLRPGDYVDVLLYIRTGTTGAGYTQTVISGARLLSYGNALESTEGNEPGAGRTAVVAVTADLVNRLLLAEQEGRLRLAARPLQTAVGDPVPAPARLADILPPAPTPAATQPQQPPAVIHRGGR